MLPKLNHEETEKQLNRPMTNKEIKSPGKDGFTGEFCQIFKGNWHQSFSNFSKNRKRGNAFKCILEDQQYLMSKPDRHATGKRITG